MNALMTDTQAANHSPKARKRVRRVDDRQLSRAVKLTYALSLRVNIEVARRSIYNRKTFEEVSQDLEQIMAIYRELG